MYSCPLKRRPPQTWSWQNPTSVHRISGGFGTKNPKQSSLVLPIIGYMLWRIRRGWKVSLNSIFKKITPGGFLLGAFSRAHWNGSQPVSHYCKQSHMRRMAKTCHANATQGIGRCATPKPIEIGKVSGRRSTKAPAWLWEFSNSKYHTMNRRSSVAVPKGTFWALKTIYSTCNLTNMVVETWEAIVVPRKKTYHAGKKEKSFDCVGVPLLLWFP